MDQTCRGTEIAIEIGRDIAPDANEHDIVDAIAAISPAIELADVDGPADDVEAILAGDIFQRHVIFWPARYLSRRRSSLTASKGILFVQVVKLLCPTILRRIPDRSGSLFGKSRKHFLRLANSCMRAISSSPDRSRLHNSWKRNDSRLTWTLDPVGSVSVNFRSHVRRAVLQQEAGSLTASCI